MCAAKREWGRSECAHLYHDLLSAEKICTDLFYGETCVKVMKRILAALTFQWRELRRGDLSEYVVRHGDLLVAAATIAAIAIIIIPIPTFLISLFIIFNLASALVVLMISLYVGSPTQISAYPTILLITTLFRLSLSIAVTRAILTTGHAGDVIIALGSVTASGNLIVGIVMFLIMLVVQFIVVAKGAERVAEVAARFTLDAMPGRQMSIDADMRAGLINQDEARALRLALQKESQLYGAMDGAMKFVKNDAVATIIVALINIAAGLTIGVLMKGLTFQQATHKFTLLTIGDGLAAIIPSVLISISAGLVITRVTSSDTGNVGSDIAEQFLIHPKPLIITAGLLLGLALIPGMPPAPLLLLSGIMATVGYVIHRRVKPDEVTSEPQPVNAAADAIHPTFTVPLSVVVSSPLAEWVDPTTTAGARFRSELPALRTAVYYDLGVLIPAVHIGTEAPLPADQYFIALKEVPILRGRIPPDSIFVSEAAANIKIYGLEGEAYFHPHIGTGCWIPSSQREIAERVGLRVKDPSEFILLHLTKTLRVYAHEFVGIQEAQSLLDFASRMLPKLVESVVPTLISVQQFAEILQRLVQERVSIRDLKSILEALAEWARTEKDTMMLTEYVRMSMKRHLSFRSSKGKGTLLVYLLDPEIEDLIRAGIRRTSSGSFVSLDPAISHDILKAFRLAFEHQSNQRQQPVVVTDLELRRFVRKFIELEFPNLQVLSYQELAPDLKVQPIARISLTDLTTRGIESFPPRIHSLVPQQGQAAVSVPAK